MKVTRKYVVELDSSDIEVICHALEGDVSAGSFHDSAHEANALTLRDQFADML
jgi:hypothetical protein